MADAVHDPTAQVMITLASLSYEHSSDIASNLARPDLAPGGDWELVWGPGLKGSNLAYVVKNKKSEEYTVAIRGTVGSLESMAEDAESFHQEPLPWLPNSEAKISRGMVHGWQRLTTATSPAPAPAPGRTIGEFLGSIPSDAIVYVTGHSQGGALTTVLAMWMGDTYPSFRIIPYTFAGETAGDPAFAARFDERFLGQPGGRYYHHLDIVPKGFVVAETETISTLYAPEPPGVQGSYLIEGTVAGVLDALRDFGVVYQQCGNPVRLPDVLVPVEGVHFYNRSDRFADEVLVQHSSFTYQALLGAPLTPGQPSHPWPPKSIPYK